ncbi:MAG: carbamoyl-phosphate synthase large subunit [Myxococcota bacterium]|nr:carbamoyl-phosphate synthase large subunit [Myxococcota bacterium]
MPRREDLQTIMVIGSGPIVIGQACEFDYSGTQACKALKALGYRVVLINSNPATIMTDPEVADATYVEPLSVRFAEQVIAREKPDAVLPTVGGQTGLNLAMALAEQGVLERYGVELIGAKPEAIEVGEDRAKFKEAMEDIGYSCPRAGTAETLQEAEEILKDVGLPAIIRPSYTLGGTGGGVAYNLEEFRTIVAHGLDLSPTRQVLVEESVLGWKEFELEVMRDLADNVIIICSIENFDPMGIHTGDSITVAPAQTLTDVEYQRLRDMSLRIIRRVGVETGGSNIQFAINPKDGEVRIIEMNPRVSRSSALASKATGFPIAKIAAQLAVGLRLDEISNDITQVTPASFEPTLDYVVVKVPRWNFEKFPEAKRNLGTSMKSVGEVMGIGRTFSEALLKAISSLEGGYPSATDFTDSQLAAALSIASPDRMAAVFECLRRGVDPSEVQRSTGIDRWFLGELAEIVAVEQQLQGRFLDGVSDEELRRAKQTGIPDAHLALILNCTEADVVERRKAGGIEPTFKRVDTCAAEFESFTPYLYSTYEEEDEAGESDSDRVIILGNGPNRIGQGLEFDYACCHAAFTVRKAGLTAVMLNNNPETVSTDYDTSDKLYFEPISKEHVQAVIDREQPLGVILQFGGQTPLKLSHRIGPVLGTSPDAIDICEDRDRFNELAQRLGIRQPEGALATTVEEAREAAGRIGFPLLVRPSYVLGGRAMRICYSSQEFESALGEALEASEGNPLLLDRYLEGAVEYDVDALCDGEDVYIAGIMEHVEEAGIHSGDSTAVLPAVLLSEENRKEMVEATTKMALALGVIGVVNLQFAIHDDVPYVFEVNPRASRTVPFVSKATGVPVASLATRLVLGEKLADMEQELKNKGAGYYFVKAPVFPWARFPGSDVVLGPEMRSTGEVMGVGRSFGEAYAKSQIAAGLNFPEDGGVFLSIRDRDKTELEDIARSLHSLGYKLWATTGTHAALEEMNIPSQHVFKVNEGRPNIVDQIKNGAIKLMINTPSGKKGLLDELAMRLAGLRYGTPCITTMSGGRAAISAIESLRSGDVEVVKLQELQ